MSDVRFIETLGPNGSIRFCHRDGRIVATWSGYSRALKFLPLSGDPIRVGYFEPKAISYGLRKIERLLNLEAASKLA